MVTVPLEPVTTKPPSLADTCGVGCSDIIYTGSPWQDGSDPHLLVIQPSCYLNLPSQGVPSLGLDLQLEFSGDVFQITVSAELFFFVLDITLLKQAFLMKEFNQKRCQALIIC